MMIRERERLKRSERKRMRKCKRMREKNIQNQKHTETDTDKKTMRQVFRQYFGDLRERERERESVKERKRKAIQMDEQTQTCLEYLGDDLRVGDTHSRTPQLLQQHLDPVLPVVIVPRHQAHPGPAQLGQK